MGCWNETCALSKLPIHLGEPVVVIITAGKATVAGPNFYYDDESCMLSFPVRGLYNEYGSIENAEMSDITKEYITQTEFLDKDGEKYEFSTMEDFFYDVSDLSIKSGQDTYYLDRIMIHARLWDNILEDFSNREYYGSCPSEYGPKIPKNLLSIFYKKVIKECCERKNYFWDFFEDKDVIKDLCSIKKALLGYSSITPYTIINLVSDKILLDSDNPDNFEKEVVDYIITAQWMNLSRISLYGQCGKGSQSNEMMIQKIIANFVIDYTDNWVSMLKEESGEEQDIHCLEETIFVPFELRKDD